ncbi:23S rRNA pseudouridine(955/2504/2580) synthase RluC [Candidatus Pantoea edessiphila]|uniref:Pseudouridine synthase n=1 Tax=Candidatus Pantoea edessiphila TaxID=2044610 RepID=A0A2P5SX07_9GAMM|nr:23S rRNA pseudouridine(955/2504/2580) synthase RluC [Candidatus Pantoea edessiphila]PPI86843.1 23S rRNA pseudouridine(955/2504/2580) synthase RluC [Candidatus Pantoea edessiphila]
MTKNYCKLQNITITDKNLNQRIDNFLYSKFKNIPKNFIYRILRKGQVRVNKKRIKPFYKLEIGDNIRIPPFYLGNQSSKQIFQKKIHDITFLNKIILYEDDSLIVLNKPSGIAVHGGSGLNFGVIEGLRALRPRSSFLELVHRIDKDTSGLLLIAKKRSMLRLLHEQLRNKSIKKTYLTLVNGIWPKSLNRINVPLIKINPRYGKSMVCVDINGRPSETYFTVEEYFQSSTLMKANPVTGYTHQIRVHTLYAGHPILFDKRYGNKNFNNKVITTGLNRLFLHAFSLTLIHPKTKKLMYIEAPIDEMLKKCLNNLRFCMKK